MNANKQIVFISCGQRTDAEKKLGEDICNLVRELTPYKPYFAENQQSLDGLIKNIFDKLNEMVGLITVMHRRGSIYFDGKDGGLIRPSVWIEQEIAIASFLVHTLKRNISIIPFIEEGVSIEGVREKLQLNPVVFKDNNEILERLKKTLGKWDLEIPKSTGPSINASLQYEETKRTSERHDYNLSVVLENKEVEIVKNYHVDLWMPKYVLINNPNYTYATEIPEKATKTHRFFRIKTNTSEGAYIYPGDTRKIISIDYFIDDDIYDNEEQIINKLGRVDN